MTQLKKADLEQMGEEYFQSLEPAQLMELAKDLHQLAMAQIDNRKQEYQSLMTASPVGILQTNLEGICTYANERYCEIVGVEATALIGQPWYKGYRSEDLARIVEEFEQSLRDDRPMSIEYRCQRPDGKETWVYGQSVVEYDTDGQAIGYVGTVTDISDRKAVELALEESEAHLSRLMGNLPGFVYRELNNSDYTPVYISPGVTAITGYLPEDYLIHRTVSCGKLIHPEDVDAVWESVQAALDANQSFKCEYRIINKAGQERWVWEKGQGTYDAAGELLYLEGFITDITDRKLAEIALHNLIEGTSATTGDDFFPALVSHIAAALDIAHVMVSELSGEDLNVQAFWSTDALQPTFSFPLANTPCERVCDEGIFYCESLVQQQFPSHLDLQAMEAQSYLGIVLQSRDKHAIGNLCILDKKPIHNRPHAEKILRAFAARAAAELERLQAKRALEQLNQELEDRVAERTAALQESQKFIQKIATASPNIIYVHDIQETRNIYINREITETLGYTPDEVQMMGSRVLERLMHPEDFRQIDAHYHRMSTAQDGDILEIEYRMQHANGEWRWLISRDTIFRRNPRGEVEQIIGTAQDITDRKAAEKALMLKQTHLAALMNNIPHLAWIKDEQSRFIAVNEPFSQSCGVLAEELVGKTDYDIWPADLAQAYRDDDAEVLQSGQRKVVEERVLLANGILGWLETTKTPFTDSSGEFAGTVGIAANITDRKTIELALKESERRYASLAAAAPVAIFRFDTPLNCIYVNERWSELSGRPMESAMGHGWMEALHPDDSEQNIAEWTEYYAQSNPESLIIHGCEGRHLRPDGTTTWCYIQVAKEFDDDGNVVGYIGTLTDITDRKQAEQKLQELSERLELAIQSAQLGIWEFDYSSHRLSWDERMLAIYGVSSEAFQGTYSDWSSRVYPDDLEQAQPNISMEQTTYDTEFRIIQPDGAVRWIMCSSFLQRNPQGELVRGVGVNRDVTDRKQVEIALEESRQKYYTLIQSVNGIVWDYDLDNEKFTFVSEKAEALLGYPVEQWLNETKFWENHVYADDLTEANYQFQLALQEQRNYELEYRMIAADGHLIWFYDVSSIHFGADGSPLSMSGILIDIGDRKMVELALKASERRYASLAAAAPVAIFRFDTPLHCIYVNERWSQMCGRPAESALGYGWMDGLHPDDRPSNINQWAEAYTQANPENPIIISGESRNLCLDGTITWSYVQIAQEFDDDGNVVGYVGTLTDITDHRVTELALQESQAQFRRLTENIPGMIYRYVLYPDGREGFTYISPQVREIYEVEADQAIRDPTLIWARIHPDDVARHQTQMLESAKNLTPAVFEHRLTTPSGLKFAKATSRPYQQDDGAIFWDGVIIDITDQKQAEYQLELTNAELIRATQLKDEFLANMSHELRTPLNVILGLTEGLQEQILGPLTARQEKALNSIQRSGSHLLSLINDVLDVAKIEAGQGNLDLNPISIKHLCRESLAFIRQPASQKQIQLNVNLPDNVPMLLVDERRIRQVLINLLSNAVKFTPDGGQITLAVDRLDTEKTPSDRWVRFAITDTGIGISPENISKLFQPFIQIDGALNRQYSGTGLGLTLAKGIIELHKGRIGVTSEQGVGSCFTIDLPAIYLDSPDAENDRQGHNHDASQETAPNSPKQNPAISPLILLAEDHEENRSTITDYLIEKGYRILTAINGVEAIALAQQFHPDLILMDIQMPVMDGLNAMIHIRHDPTLATVPIIALTALAMAGDRERCLKAGANEYISKPVRLKQLVTIINQLLAV